ncbi:hypothetical protein [Thalassobacillus sp. CUG 92003]|uniref:hypothetical protein n=1 Tax=Thalassobacillus sp. CUG 92003 TaxID=2736641 RepID=UPI0015E76EBB|nr:hypothetical protein [Thalassobacillus sp. CUG 92003]
MAENINYTDTLRRGTDKLNDSINDANYARTTADTAKSTADIAKTQSDQAINDSSAALQYNVGKYRTPSATFSDIDTDHPGAEENDRVFVRDTGKVYVKESDGSWKEFSEITAGPVNEVDDRLSSELNDIRTKRIQYVTYAMFSPPSDGVSDDGPAIKEAHEYANQNNLPVINTAGEYWINNTRNIPVKTNTDLGSSIFHIDETYNDQGHVFLVESDNEFVTVDSGLYDAILPQLIKGTEPVISELDQYNNHFLVIEDANNQVGKRVGSSVSWNMTDICYLDEHGRIVGEITWDWGGITSITAKEAEKNYLIVEGGTFLLNGQWDDGSTSTTYGDNGFLITRARTIIRGQFVGLEEGTSDNNQDPVHGFYYYEDVYDVKLEDVRVMPREKDRSGTSEDIGAGTYGIGGRRVLRSTFKNVSANGSEVHWGVFGTNMFKDFNIENCALNRVDIHFHCWNLTVNDTFVGEKGFTLTGGGKLRINNTSVKKNSFIFFRGDYGSKWDGDIDIDNCTQKIQDTETAYILEFVGQDTDYGYIITNGKNININNFTFDYDDPSNDNIARLMTFHTDGLITTTNERRRFPTQINVKNVKVQGRDKGIRLFHMADPINYYVPKVGSIDSDEVTTNTTWHFENLELESMSAPTNSIGQNHIYVGVGNDDNYGPNSIYPKITVIDCKHFHYNASKTAHKLTCERSQISVIDHYNGGAHGKGTNTFINCEFKPNITSDTGQDALFIESDRSTYIDCIFFPIIYDGSENLTQTEEQYGTFSYAAGSGGVVYGNFLFCKLSDKMGSIPSAIESGLRFNG